MKFTLLSELPRIILAMTLCHFALSVFSQSIFESKAVPGKVTDTVKCRLSPQQSYALYLPKKYTNATLWPAIFLFDPAARGGQTISGYKEIAERFQCILICSNNSRNGPVSLIREAENAVWVDATSRYALALDHLLISGFSGGARSAVDLALRRRTYAGIIACGAGFPSDQFLSARDSIPFIEVIGNEDMNLDEAFEIHDYLKKINHVNYLLPFEGPHGWPSSQVYEQAVFWQFLQLAKNNGSMVADSLHNNQEAKLLSLVAQEIDSGDFYLAHLNVLQATAQPVNYSPAVEAIQKLISTNSKLSLQKIEFPKLLNKEASLKGQFSELFSALLSVKGDADFIPSDWKILFASLNSILRSKNRLEHIMGKRVQNWMLLVSNSELKNQFQIKDYFHASLLASVLVLLDDSHSSYLKLSRAYAARGMKKESLLALRKSYELGLTDKSAIEADPYLSILHGEKSYEEILVKLKLNKLH